MGVSKHKKMGMHLQYVMAMTQWDCFFRSDFEVPGYPIFQTNPKRVLHPCLLFLWMKWRLGSCSHHRSLKINLIKLAKTFERYQICSTSLRCPNLFNATECALSFPLEILTRMFKQFGCVQKWQNPLVPWPW